MTAPACDTIALYDAPDGEQLRKLWRGVGQVTATTLDSHVPDGRGGVLPITELDVVLGADVDLEKHNELWNWLGALSDARTPCWIAWGESFVRVRRWSRHWRGGPTTFAPTTRVHCSTGRPSVARTADGAVVTCEGEPVAIALTEPSPPVPDRTWLADQRRAASDRLLAAPSP